MSEKAISIASYCAGSGAYVIMGITNPTEASEAVTSLLSEEWEKMVGGKIEFVTKPKEMVERILDHIDKKRAALGLPEYDPGKFGQSGDTRMNELLELKPEERAAALYGQPASD
jgi:carbon-monoxide dehydrogenase catalytic subunit